MRAGALFTEEHELFRKSVRSFVEREVVPRVDEWEARAEIPRLLFRSMGELGFLGVEFPPEYGGAGADFGMSVVLAEELARCRSGGVAFSVIVHTDMSSPWLVRFGTDEQKARYLPAIARGEKVCALAITEPGAGSDMAALATRARRDGDDWVITGNKTFITNGVYGDLYFVAARTREDGPRHGQLSQFLVERGTRGLTVSGKLEKTGMWASDTAELSLDQVQVPAENLLGEEGRGFYQLAAGLQRERLMAAVLCVSGAQQALEDCQAFLRQRQAFGRPLAELQALRHRMADMATQIEGARRLTYHAAERFAAAEDCVTEVSMAKLFATEMANRVAYEAVQLHGGYGYMREFHVERFARDYRVWTIASGSSEIMREIIAKRLPV
ncbi:MAG: acyl-CoA dehydrogenase family protein [Candidatus Methylomirabilia bacterium]